MPLFKDMGMVQKHTPGKYQVQDQEFLRAFLILARKKIARGS
ncbi:hypothetical protein KCP70_05615 [Salmonella enterica subsp. enterica]|nr:hypothetical protein KCP70_05615 [Salmonella enterica subsp. enterica]